MEILLLFIVSLIVFINMSNMKWKIKPQMDEHKRTQLIAGWDDAVKRSFGIAK